MSTELVAGLMLKIVFMAVLGFILGKMDIIDEPFQKKLSTILLNVVIPCSMLANANTGYTRDMAGNLVWVAVAVVAYYLLVFAGALPLSRALPIPPGSKNTFVNLVVLANTGYIGFPVVEQLFGAEGALYNIIYNLGFNLFAFTVGITLMGGAVSVKTFFTRPTTLVPILAILLFVSPVRMPGMVADALREVAGLSAAFSMFITGASLSRIRLPSIFTDGWAWLASALRQLVLPAIMAAVLWAAGLRGVMPATLVVVTGLPSATVNVIFAQQFQRDVPFATRAVVQGTLLMVVTLPLCALLCAAIF